MTSEIKYQVSQSITDFGYSLLRKINQENPNQNIVFSPLSLATTISMVAAGAQGDTKKELMDALALKDWNDLVILFKQMLPAAGSESPLFCIANMIAVDRNFVINKAYNEIVRKEFDSRVKSMDFSEPEHCIYFINQWAEYRTEGKIQHLLSQLPGDNLCALNAVVFQGLWKHPFDGKETVLDAFQRSNGDIIEALFMHSSRNMKYFEEKEMMNEKKVNAPCPFQAVQLEYESSDTSVGPLSFLTILPGKSATDKTRIHQFIDWINSGGMSSIVDNMEERKGTLLIPRFTVEQTFSLHSHLKQMGIENAFSPKADFSAIGERVQGQKKKPLALNDLIHKARVEINEEGTEASVASVLGMRAMAVTEGLLKEPFEMKMDHPFLFGIMHNETVSKKKNEYSCYLTSNYITNSI
eukprot:gb/GECH01006089.1/.p1 GENE.gb/GECH01006089.1/~~gb/GECH01006089.1/.p1  ORF type:complete len:411 (+),score=112.98 gb/GECH01006089.1/:1-1233(+)